VDAVAVTPAYFSFGRLGTDKSSTLSVQLESFEADCMMTDASVEIISRGDNSAVLDKAVARVQQVGGPRLWTLTVEIPVIPAGSEGVFRGIVRVATGLKGHEVLELPIFGQCSAL